MSNYVKAVDYSAKDALASGNPNKIIKGTELNDEFNAIATAIGTKADLASPVFLGNPTATTQAFGNSSTRLATTSFVQTALQALHPVGSIYINASDNTNPATLFGFGTWVTFGAGRVMVGFNTSDPLFDTSEETGGSKDAVVVSHTHTLTDPGHSHTGVVNFTGFFGTGPGDRYSNNTSTDSTTTGITVDSTGVSGTNANLPPYVVVYMWKRTA